MVIVPSPERFAKVADILKKSGPKTSAALSDATQIKRSDLSPLITQWVRMGYMKAIPLGNRMMGNEYSLSLNGEKVFGLVKKGVRQVTEADLKKYGISINVKTETKSRDVTVVSQKKKTLISPATVDVLKRATTMNEVSEGLARISSEVFKVSQSAQLTPKGEPTPDSPKSPAGEPGESLPEERVLGASGSKTQSLAYQKLLSSLSSKGTSSPQEKEAAPSKSTQVNMMKALRSAQGLANSIASLVMDAVAEEVEAQLESMKDEIARVVRLKFEAERESVRLSEMTPSNEGSEATREKLRILIVGLLPGQKTQIEQEFGKEFDLRFAESNLMGKSLKKKVMSCDYCLSMVNFIGHPTENTILSTEVKYEKVAGGMSSLRDRLTSLYVDGSKDERREHAA